MALSGPLDPRRNIVAQWADEERHRLDADAARSRGDAAEDVEDARAAARRPSRASGIVGRIRRALSR